MIFYSISRRVLLGAMLVSLWAGAWASGSDKAKDKDASHQVDSGTFGIFAKGNRVATETFSIQQNSDSSVIKSQFRADSGSEKAVQSSELHISNTGDLRQYDWKEVTPGNAQISVTPAENALIERSLAEPKAKPSEMPFLVPASTSIVDDYFFVHVELLAWKYLATTCHTQSGHIQCPLNQSVQIGTLNPHAHTVSPIFVSFAGLEKIPVRGVNRDLNRVNLKTDSSHWTLWLDDQFKLLRIVVGDDGTEVVRD